VQSKGRRAKRKVERKTREYQGRVMLLETRFKAMEESYKNKGGNIIWEWTKLVFGVCSIILSAFWMLQFFLFTLPVAVGQPPVIPLINTFLMLVQPIPFLGPFFFGYAVPGR
jgi:LMBR1 domain-containing protein 1